MQVIGINLKILDKRYGNTWALPNYQLSGDAAMDLRAAISEPVRLLPGEQREISTGIAIHISVPGYAGLVLPRSGCGKIGLVLANSVGVIDSGYQGEILIQAWNRLPKEMDTHYIQIRPGDRIAQLMIIPVISVRWYVVEEFGPTERDKHGMQEYQISISERGERGFGSTGTSSEGATRTSSGDIIRASNESDSWGV